MTHEEVIPGRGSPALAKISRSRSNSRDSSSERKKLDSENTQCKLTLSGKKGSTKQSQDNVNSDELEVPGKDKTVCDGDSVEKNGEGVDNNTELEKKVKKKGRPKSESFTHIKQLANQTAKTVVIKEEGNKSEVISVKPVQKKRGRPKSLDLMNSESIDTEMNGEDDYFKSPHPLTPCNIQMKPKKGRPKETPPTLEPEPSLSPNTLTIADSVQGNESQSVKQESKRKAGPGRPPKKRKILKPSEVGNDMDKSDKPGTKNKLHNSKLLDKKTFIGKRKHVVPLKAKAMIFKGKCKLGVKKIENKKTVDVQFKRKAGRPPGAKNKPKPVTNLIRESKLRRNSKDSENSLDMSKSVEPDTSELINENKASDINTVESSDPVSRVTSSESSIVDSINSVIRKEKMLSKKVKMKDPLRKGLLSKGKVNPKSKTLKNENSLPVIKRKKTLALHAKKHTDSSIASLPSNDLRRKLYRKLHNELNVKEKQNAEDIKEKNVDEKEDNVSLSELKKQNANAADDKYDESNISDGQVEKPGSDVQNLSAMVESKRFAKGEKDLPIRKVGRPKKIVSDIGKASDNESTCSEISSYSAVSHSTLQTDEMTVNDVSKVKKKPGRKRKLTLNEESVDMKSDLQAPGLEMVPKSGAVYDFAADEEANNNVKTDIEVIKRKRGRPKVLKLGNTNKATVKTAFQSTMKQTIRTPMKKDVLKHLNKVKKAKDIKSKLLKSEFMKRKRENEVALNDSMKHIDEAKDKQNADVNSETSNPNGNTQAKLSIPYDKDKDTVNDNKGCGNIDDTDTEICKVKKESLIDQVQKDNEIQAIQTDKKEESQQVATSDIDSNIDQSNNVKDDMKDKMEETCLEQNVLVNNDKHDVGKNKKDTELEGSNISQNSEETEESDQEKCSFKFDSQSIMDRARAISFEVNEKKRLLKEKILKGREFSKSFMHKAVEVENAVDENEPVLPDNDTDIEQCSTYSSKTEELNISIEQEEKFLSDDGADEMNFVEEDTTESAENVVEEMLVSLIDQVCKQVKFNSTIDLENKNKMKGNSVMDSMSSSVDEAEKNIREFLGNIPDSVQSMKTFNVGKEDSKNVTFKAKRRVKKVEPVMWRRKVRKREKKLIAETETPVVRKIELRQKISRSPLDNIALRQSIEENEYLREQMKKTKRGPKPKLKVSPTVEPEMILGTSKLLEQTVDEKQISETAENVDLNTNTEVDFDESSSMPTITIDDLLKECKPCSVILKDFLKELQMKSTMENLDESQESSQVSEEEDTENNKLTRDNELNVVEEGKAELSGADGVCNETVSKETVSEININEQSSELMPNADLTSESKETKPLSNIQISPTKDEHIPLEKEEQMTGSNETSNEQCQKPVTESMNNEVVKKRRRRKVKGIRDASDLNLPRRTLRPREASPKAENVPNKAECTKDKTKKPTSEASVQKPKIQVNSIEPTEQTARKTVPPLKIKLSGGLSSKTKVYTVETAVNASPSSVDSALNKKPKRKFKSKSKSDSESEKSEKHHKSHHHSKKHSKSPEKSEENDSGKQSEMKKVEHQKTGNLKAQDAYEANFLAFIQKQEKDEVNMANWRNPAVSKTSHQLVGGKACKSGDDGALTVSACALAETKTSSIGSDKFVTVSKSSAVSSTDNKVHSSPMELTKKTVDEEVINDKKSELEHFQQTEKVVNNLVSKIPSKRQYFCNHCEFLCETQNEIMEHTKSLHKDQLLYSCTICHKVTFKTKPAIMAHFITYHQGMKDSYICLPDYFEKQIEPKPVKSPTDQSDNIFDRMSNLFDIQTSKAEPGKTVVNPPTESVGPTKTAAEADSTTKLDEGEDQLSNKAASIADDSGEEIISAENEKQDDKDLQDTSASAKTR